MTGETAAPLEPAYLPGPGTTGRWHVGHLPGGVRFRVPRLDEHAASDVARRVSEAALRARAERPLDAVVRALGSTGARFGRPADPLRERAVRLLVAELEWPEALAAETLEQMAAIWTEEALWSSVRRELGDPGVLDGWAREAGGARRHRAAGPPLVLTVHAGNVPGVSVTAAIRTLLVRSGSLNRVASGEPGLLGLFARGLAEADPLLGASLAATWWPPDPEVDAVEAAWVKQSGKVVLYGGEEAILALRRRLPAHVEPIVYGARLGLAAVLPDALEGDALAGAAEALARDALAYEGRGCVTPRVVFPLGATVTVARRFADRLAGALGGERGRGPRPRVPAEAALAIRALRARHEFGGGAGEGRAVWGSDEDLSWTVVLGTLEPGAWELLPSVIAVVPAPDPSGLERALRPLRGRLQAVGYAGEEGLEQLADACARLGVARLAPLGTVAWPPADWHHDGRGQLQPLLEWTDWELPSPDAS